MAVVGEHRDLLRAPPADQGVAATSDSTEATDTENVVDRVADLVDTMLDKDEDAGARVEATTMLVHIGSQEGGAEALRPAVPMLRLALESASSVCRRNADGPATCVHQEATKALGRAGAPGVAELTRSMLNQSNDQNTRRWAAEGLVRLARAEGGEARLQPAVPGLALALERDDNGLVQDAAAGALAKAGPQGVAALNSTMVNSTNKNTARQKAAGALRDLALSQGGRGAPLVGPVVPGLLMALEDEDVKVRHAAARTLASAQPQALRPFVSQLATMVLSTAKGVVREVWGDHLVAEDLGCALGKLGADAGIGGLRALLAVVKRFPSNVNLQRSVEQVQRALEIECASALRRQSSEEVQVEGLLAVVSNGTALLAGDRGAEAHRCANAMACMGDRKVGLTPDGAPAGTFKTSSCHCACPLMMTNSSEAKSSMCSAGYDPSSPGCTKCAKEFGRKNADPFNCEKCGTSKLLKWAGWVGQPLVLFLVSLYSAETALEGEADTLANEVVKILCAYLASVGVVISSLASTKAFQKLGAQDNQALDMLGVTTSFTQAGDVTYSSGSDCLLHNGDRAATVHELLLLSLAKPAVVLAVAAILLTIRACLRAAMSQGAMGMKEICADVMDGTLTASIVAGWQFLPSVAAACVNAGPCFHTQTQATGDDGAGLLKQHMAYSLDEECGGRDQYRYLMTCGPVFAFTFLAGPVYWQAMRRYTKGEKQAGALRFLIGAYRDGYRWWESGRLIKTMLIACAVAASPTSYCAAQQLSLGLMVTVAFAVMHSFSRPYGYMSLNLAEACSLGVLCFSMALAGMLAGGSWSMTKVFRHELLLAITLLLALNFVSLAILWVRIKFFWHDGTDLARPAFTGQKAKELLREGAANNERSQQDDSPEAADNEPTSKTTALGESAQRDV